MTDLTPLFSHLLSAHSAPPIPPSRKPPLPRDSFLKEAYLIASHLHAVFSHLSRTRQPYLSTTSTRSPTHLTDPQRDALDSELKASIRTILTLISRLESTEQIRTATAKQVLEKKYSTLRAIFSGDEERELEEARVGVENAHRESVIWGLKRALEVVGEEQRGRQEVRLKRQVEKGRSLLHQAGAPRATAAAVAMELGESKAEREQIEELTPDQIQMFEQENRGMLRHYEDTLQQVKSAESSLMEISELQTQLATSLAHQNVHIDNLMQDSMQTQENLARGNRELKKAAEQSSVARTAFLATVVFSSVVFVWDWFI